ncbi:HAMP domain-containing protein [Endozoicomonas sp. G2_1]|uniref:HAMP domain-containing methyl-accepting chemotaxis protein n=1 Tax=Endozoicomonas sp. G2_1 TaxID=2821091 RepID=UPI001ADA49B5|nr:methyl-accepting chemotaxis protein [Endozoicomonas sp. G2_1]MBO9489255.1 HAMP domain-containing protein [Endozoicomonas sp. G2_1]
MTITVAHKIILGFLVIVILLVIASATSMNILFNIEDANHQVDTLALPIQKQSNTLQLNLLREARQVAEIERQFNDTELLTIQQKIAQQSKQILASQQKIEQLLGQQSSNFKLSAFKQDYRAYQQAVEKMLHAQQQRIKQELELKRVQDSINLHLDEASAVLVDLSYLEDSQRQDDIDRIASVAGLIEGYLIQLLELNETVLALTTASGVEQAKADTEQAVGQIDQQIAFLQRLGEAYNTDGLIDDFVEQYQNSIALLLEQNGLFDVKAQQLAASQTFSQARTEAEQNLEQGLAAINTLSTWVDNNLTELQSVVYQDVSQGKTTTVVILVVVFIAAVTIAFVTIKAMLVPLARINKALGYIADGDLSRKLSVKSQDEYGELATNVNAVVDDLRHLIDNIKLNTTELGQASTDAASEIHVTAETLAAQSQSVEQMTQITEQLSASAEQVLSQASSAEHKMTDALGKSQQLETIAQNTNGHINSLATSLDSSTEIMSALHQESTNIGSILETIQSIADQTNLLALNAAIEAARAGEAGRGFAVVADEVRLLASRTQESTAEIHRMIEALQQQANKAVAGIRSGKTEVDGCLQATQELLATLALINQAIAEMHTMSTDIAGASTEQNSLSDEITHNIGQVLELSHSSSDKAQRSLAHGDKIQNLTEALNHSVSAFKLDKS